VALSTRIARYARPLRWRGPSRALALLEQVVPLPRQVTRAVERLEERLPGLMTPTAELPMAYLLDERECNDDPSNFWIFTEAGLKRILARTNWEILDFRTFGDRWRSNPSATDRDERAFCLARSRVFKG
jgi:hypothetical protein